MTPTQDRTETNWFTVKVQNMYEKKVKERINIEMSRAGKDFKIIIPTKREYIVKKGKKVPKDTTLYPGYIFVETENVSLLKDIVRSTTGATNVLSDKNKHAIRLKHHEVISMLLAEEELQKPVSDEFYIIGQTLKIIDGPFLDFVGKIGEINMNTQRVVVFVKIFGREQRVDLTFDQVTKI